MPIVLVDWAPIFVHAGRERDIQWIERHLKQNKCEGHQIYKIKLPDFGYPLKCTLLYYVVFPSKKLMPLCLIL